MCTDTTERLPGPWRSQLHNATLCDYPPEAVPQTPRTVHFCMPLSPLTSQTVGPPGQGMMYSESADSTISPEAFMPVSSTTMQASLSGAGSLIRAGSLSRTGSLGGDTIESPAVDDVLPEEPRLQPQMSRLTTASCFSSVSELPAESMVGSTWSKPKRLIKAAMRLLKPAEDTEHRHAEVASMLLELALSVCTGTSANIELFLQALGLDDRKALTRLHTTAVRVGLVKASAPWQGPVDLRELTNAFLMSESPSGSREFGAEAAAAFAKTKTPTLGRSQSDLGGPASGAKQRCLRSTSSLSCTSFTDFNQRQSKKHPSFLDFLESFKQQSQESPQPQKQFLAPLVESESAPLKLAPWRSQSSNSINSHLEQISESGVTYHSEFDCIGNNHIDDKQEVMASYTSTGTDSSIGIRSRCLKTQNEWQRRLLGQQRTLLDVVSSKLKVAEENVKVGEDQKELLRSFRRIIRREVVEDERFHQVSLCIVESDSRVSKELTDLSRILDYPCQTYSSLNCACDAIKEQTSDSMMTSKSRPPSTNWASNSSSEGVFVLLLNMKALDRGLPPELKELNCSVVLLSHVEELENVGSYLLASSEAEIRDRLKERGIGDYLLRPLSLDGLRGVVSQAIRRFFGDEYLLLNTVGRGGFGIVHKAKRLGTGDTFALKEINTKRLSALAKADIDREGQLMQDLHWPTVMYVVDIWDNNRDRLRYLLMPIMEGGSLKDRIGNISEDDGEDLVPPQKVHEWYVQCLHGICYLHSHGVLHRDLKLANILLGADDVALRICDLGSAARLPGPGPHPVRKSTLPGAVTTPLFAPPEVILDSYYCPGSDMWQCGATFYEVVTLEPVFAEGTTMAELIEQVRGFDFTAGPWHGQMLELKPDPLPVSQFCEMMQRDPMLRPTASELVGRTDNSKRLMSVLGHSPIFSNKEETRAHFEEFKRIQKESDSAEHLGQSQESTR